MAKTTRANNALLLQSALMSMARALGVVALVMLALPSFGRTAAAQPAACKVAVLGDSLTAGYGLASGKGFPARLQEALRSTGVSCDVIDAGVSGDTSAGGLSRLDWVLADKPTHLIVELGANDGLRVLPTLQLEHNLDTIVSQAQAKGVEVFLAGMLAPPNLGQAYGKSFAKVFQDVARRHGIPLYTFFLDGVAGIRKLNQADGIHPTAEGIDIIVAKITPAVVKWLNKEP